MKPVDQGLNPTTKRTRKPEFLGEMERVVPIKAHASKNPMRCRLASAAPTCCWA